MINFDALFSVSYGLYLVSSGDKDKGNGFISNTVFQITSEPPMFSASCNKNNYTTEFILQQKAFAVSVLHTQSSQDLIGIFGYKTGRETEKMKNLDLVYGETGVPIVKTDAMAFLEFSLADVLDEGTHFLFIGKLLQAEMLKPDAEPLTYLYYRKFRKGISPKNAPTHIDPSKLTQSFSSSKPSFKCGACGFVYDENLENHSFSSLPADWTCPLCGAGKEDFYKL